MFENEQQKMAFMAEPTDRQAEHILAALQQLDRANGTAAQATSADPPTAANTPATAMVVAPQAGGGKGPRRQPVYLDRPQPQAAQAAQDAAAPKPPAQAAAVDLGPILDRLGAIQTTLEKNAQAAKAYRDEIMASIESLRHLVAVQTALSLMLAEQTFNAGRVDILETANADAASILAQVGKAKK
jgi:hypothetical protein